MICQGCHTLPAEHHKSWCRHCLNGGNQQAPRCTCGVALYRGACAHCDDIQPDGDCRCAHCEAIIGGIAGLCAWLGVEAAETEGQP